MPATISTNLPARHPTRRSFICCGMEHCPTRWQLDELKSQLRAERELPRGVVNFIKSAPKGANPMDIMRTGVSMLGLYDSGLQEEAGREDANRRRAISITSKVGVIAAYFHCTRQGLPLPEVRTDLDEAAHFLYLLNGTEPSAEAARTLDVAYVLHADHGMNASTFSARVTIATLSDIYSASDLSDRHSEGSAARRR